MRAAELSNRAMELKKELEEMQQLEQEYVANPNATLGDFRVTANVNYGFRKSRTNSFVSLRKRRTEEWSPTCTPDVWTCCCGLALHPGASQHGQRGNQSPTAKKKRQRRR